MMSSYSVGGSYANVLPEDDAEEVGYQKLLSFLSTINIPFVSSS